MPLHVNSSHCLTGKPGTYLAETSPPKDDILYHERQLLAHEPVLTAELKELQEQKELEYQYHRITSKLSSDQQALLQLHTGIQPTPQTYNNSLYSRQKGYTSGLAGSHMYSGSAPALHSSSNLYPSTGYQSHSHFGSTMPRMGMTKSDYGNYGSKTLMNPQGASNSTTLAYSQNVRNFLQPGVSD